MMMRMMMMMMMNEFALTWREFEDCKGSRSSQCSETFISQSSCKTGQYLAPCIGN